MKNKPAITITVTGPLNLIRVQSALQTQYAELRNEVANLPDGDAAAEEDMKYISKLMVRINDKLKARTE